MPIYEYKCRKCGEVVEKIQKFSDPPLKRHSGCGGSLTKLISQSAFQFKGTGWYVTDYARKDAKEAGESGSGNGDKSAGEGDKKKDTASDDSGGSGKASGSGKEASKSKSGSKSSGGAGE